MVPNPGTSDLALHVAGIAICDTHEHLFRAQTLREQGPDVLADLFCNYILDDLLVAGASPADLRAVLAEPDTDVGERFRRIEAAWRRCRHTGYGEAVRLAAREVYEIEEITATTLAAARQRNLELRRGGRLALLRDTAGLDHVQIHDHRAPCDADPEAPEFFLSDISFTEYVAGCFDPRLLQADSGVEVQSVADLRAAIDALFARHAPAAIAVKTAHAYFRSLAWSTRGDAEIAAPLERLLADAELTAADRAALGDWCLARGIEAAIAHDLPVKIHTGYLAGQSHMPIDELRAAHLCGLLDAYPAARFVLMHASYPYGDELLALAKHYPSVYVDLCWAWTIDPPATCELVRRAIHLLPDHKLFGFGGDTAWPTMVVGYALQARHWLTRALQAEVDDGLLTQGEAMDLATRFLRENQQACFDLEGTRTVLRERLAPPSLGPGFDLPVTLPWKRSDARPEFVDGIVHALVAPSVAGS